VSATICMYRKKIARCLSQPSLSLHFVNQGCVQMGCGDWEEAVVQVLHQKGFLVIADS
jgi:hypothetical protein